MMKALVGYFEEWAALEPERVALSSGGLCLSYRDLNARSNVLAHALIERGAGPEKLVTLELERGVDAIIAMLAVMKSGAAYMAIEPGLPAERVERMFAVSSPIIRLVGGAGPGRAVNASYPSVNVGDVLAGCTTNPGLSVEADQLCYLMFTSGSSGRPKGVMVTHGNLDLLFPAVQEQWEISAEDVWTQSHSLGFGFSVWEVFGALRHSICSLRFFQTVANVNQAVA